MFNFLRIRILTKLVFKPKAEFFYGAHPAVHYILYGEPRHTRMPFPSGLGNVLKDNSIVFMNKL